MKKTVILINLLLLSVLTWSNNYYVSPQGNDSNDGLYPTSPWKTVEKVNQTNFQPGDSILFESGGVYVGSLKINNSGTKESPIVISSYGDGDKPILSGSVHLSEWKKKSSNIYTNSLDKTPYSLFKGEERLTLARWPNKGYFKIDEGDKLSLTDNQFEKIEYSLAGASARIKSVDWQSETMEVKKNIGNRIFFADTMIYSCKKDYGYILDNKYEFLDTINEWYYDEDKSKLYLLQNEMPSNIEVNTIDTGIIIASEIHDVVIENLRIEKFNTAGVFGKSFSKNIKIDNCDITNTMVFGVYIDKGTNNYTLTNNSFKGIPGRGISTLESSHLLIEDNILTHIGLLPGYGFNGVNNEVAIAILKSETIYYISDQTIRFLKDEKANAQVVEAALKIKDLPFSGQRFMELELEKLMPEEEEWITKIVKRVGEELSSEQLQSSNNVVSGNYIDSIGYIGIRLDGTNSLAENNVVKNTILHMNDGGAIYCWAQHFNYTYDNVIRNNIVINPVGSKEATPNNRLFGIGIYVDNKCKNITIEGNTVLQAKAGILLNDNSFGHTIRNNTTYDNLYGVMFSEYYRPGTLKDCVTENNIIFSKQRHQRCIFNETRISEELNASTFNNNFYGSPYYTYPLLELTYKDGVRRYHEYTLESWQHKKNEDVGSREFAPEDPEDRGNESFILINDTKQPKTFIIDKDREAYDINGKLINKKVTLQPFTSMIGIME
ncbi:MAG: right-handed parallel beta-helix repeat-containing protein [Bacteroidota bacterium]